MAYPRPITASLLQSGLAGTLGYTVLAADGTTVLVARTTAGVAEDGTSAIYSATVANWNPAWSGTIKWDAGAGTLATEAFLAYAPQTGDAFAALAAGVTLASNGLDAVMVAGKSLVGALRVLLAALAGPVSGAGTSTVTVLDAIDGTTPRITMTVDAYGNRTGITINWT